MKIFRFNEQRDYLTKLEDYIHELEDIGFTTSYSNDGNKVECKYNGKYDLLKVLDIYHELVEKINMDMYIIDTSFAFRRTTLNIKFEVSENPEGTNSIVIDMPKKGMTVFNIKSVYDYIGDKVKYVKLLTTGGETITWFIEPKVLKDGILDYSKSVPKLYVNSRHNNIHIDRENVDKVFDIIKRLSPKSYDKVIEDFKPEDMVK